MLSSVSFQQLNLGCTAPNFCKLYFCTYFGAKPFLLHSLHGYSHSSPFQELIHISPENVFFYVFLCFFLCYLLLNFAADLEYYKHGNYYRKFCWNSISENYLKQR